MNATIARSSARTVVAVVFAAVVTQACDDPLEVDIVGTVTDESINSAASANALRVGTLGSINGITAGATGTFERGWVDIGLLADEWKTSGPQQQYGELDRRTVPNTNTNLQNYYASLHRTRARAREAIDALIAYRPSPAWGIGQMYIATALAELQLAEHFCNGVPLSGLVDGVVTYGPPRPISDILALASAHLDTAFTYLTATDATTVLHLNLAKILKARVLLNIGGQAPAAAAAVAGIPTSYAYQLTFAQGTGDNGIWAANTSIRAATVGDSVDPAGTIANALPFASANDPRVRVLGSSTGTSSQGVGADGGTNMVVQQMWGRSDAVNLASGLDARLVEAEAALQADNFTAMMTILNGLRAAPPALTSLLTPAAMPPLPVPANKTAAVTLFFREKAFWTFGRGQRFGDLRRLVRQYGRPQNQVFPSGTFFKGGTYGTDVNFDVSSLELTNPQFTACLDRNA
jgi:starch-binding outer membrane protein, SusD/RagB family